MLEFFTLHFFTIFTVLIVFIAIGHLLSQRKKPASTIAWTVVILTLPYLGVLLYMMFQDRKLDKIVRNIKAIKLPNIHAVSIDVEVEKLLRNNGIAGVSGENDVVICVDGVDAYEKLMALLESAKKSIYISTYIFGNDDVTNSILDLLCEKAKLGLDVKLLIDAVGSQYLEIFPSSLRRLSDAGGEYHFFMSMIKQPANSKLNLRNHRKMIVVDGNSVMSGGINISKEYLSSKMSDDLWMDFSFILRGVSALHYGEIFRYNWESDTKRRLERFQALDLSTRGTSLVQVVPSGPDVDRDALYEAFLALLYGAREKIWIVTPYFAPDSSLLDALIVAKHRGVSIKIITPKSSDNVLVDISRGAFLRDLQKEEVDILFFDKGMLHAKAYLVDDCCAVLGSSNFDARSFFYNFEVVSFFYSKKDIEDVSQWIERLFPLCEEGIPKGGRMRVLLENMFKIFAPAL